MLPIFQKITKNSTSERSKKSRWKNWVFNFCYSIKKLLWKLENCVDFVIWKRTSKFFGIFQKLKENWWKNGVFNLFLSSKNFLENCVDFMIWKQKSKTSFGQEFSIKQDWKDFQPISAINLLTRMNKNFMIEKRYKSETKT